MGIEPEARSFETLRALVAEDIRRAFSKADGTLIVETNEEYLASGNPRAISLHEKGLLSRYISFSFEPAGIATAHVGCILMPDDGLVIGLHSVEPHIDTYRASMERQALALGLDAADVPEVKERQVNFRIAADQVDPALVSSRVRLLCLALHGMLLGPDLLSD